MLIIHLISGEIKVDSFEEIFELFFGMTKANIVIPEGYKLKTDNEEELLREIFTDYLFVLDTLLEEFFEVHSSLKCNFKKESIKTFGYKWSAYQSVRTDIVEKVYQLMPKKYDDDCQYVFIAWNNYEEVIREETKHVITQVGAKYRKVIHHSYAEIREEVLQIISVHLSVFEELAWHLDSVSKMTNIPDINEHRIIKKARELFNQRSTSNTNYTQRDALVEANEYEGSVFQEVEIEKIKFKRKEKLKYLRNEKFTKELLKKWDIRFNTEIDNKIKSKRLKKDEGGK